MQLRRRKQAAPVNMNVELKRHCSSPSLTRGLRIAGHDEDITERHFEPMEGSLLRYCVRALVASERERGVHYRSRVVLDEDMSRIVDYSCNCEAAYSYKGMCKHAAAVALSFNEDRNSYQGYQDKRVFGSSPALKSYLRQNSTGSLLPSAVRADEDAAAPALGSLDLQPCLKWNNVSWELSLKLVAPNCSYIVKDITDFADDLRFSRYRAYGKKLGFVHTLSAFNEHGRELASYIVNSIELRQHIMRSSNSYYNQLSSARKAMPLSNVEAIKFLDMYLGRSVDLEIERNSELRWPALPLKDNCIAAPVVNQEPDFELRLDWAVEGFQLSSALQPKLIASGQRCYLFHQGVFYNCGARLAEATPFIKQVINGAYGGKVNIALEDMPGFCQSVLPGLEAAFPNMIIAPEVEDYRPQPCQLEFYFDREHTRVTAELRARYGSTTHIVIGHDAGSSIKSGSGESARNLALEAQGRKLLGEYFQVPDKEEAVPAILDSKSDEARLAGLLFGGLARFREMGTVFSTPAFERLLSDRQPKLSTGLSIAGNLIRLRISGEDIEPDEVAALLASYRKRKNYHRLKDGSFIEISQLDLHQLDLLMDDMELELRDLSDGEFVLPGYRAHYLDQVLEDIAKDDAFQSYVDKLDHAKEREHELPPCLQGVLRGYQVEGYRWLSSLCDLGFGGILADEMGLGKSVQLIALLLDRNAEAGEPGSGKRPSIIVCPASLVYNWLAEFERFAPQLDVRVISGSKPERSLLRAKHGEADVLITSYDLLRLDIEEYSRMSFHICTLDEAQYIKNANALTSKACKRLDAQHRFALTGTPIENRLSELWSIFDFLMPGFLGSYKRFKERFEFDILGGDEDASRRLSAMLSPFMMRRLKRDVLRDLPDKLESCIRVQMTPEQQKLYNANEQRLRQTLISQRKSDFEQQKIEILAELSKLRQICCDPALYYEDYKGSAAKPGAIVELLDAAMQNGEKTLIFSQFVSFLKVIAQALSDRNIPYYTITGSTPKLKRLELVNAFNSDDTPVFLISLKAGGTGLNLTGASVVLHADPWWNAAAQNQATDRAHRIGQENVVSVYKVIARDSIEERIVKLQEKKSELAERILSASGSSLGSLSKEELLELLG